MRAQPAIMPRPEAAAVAPAWAQPLRWLTYAVTATYYRSAYRVRGWGRWPREGGPVLVIANHQHQIESPILVGTLGIATRAWRYPIFTVSSRRMWEPGFLAERLPWLAFGLRGVNLGPLFSALGMQPIENELHSRPFVSLAHTIHERFGDVTLAAVFHQRALQRLPREARTLRDLLGRRHFAAARAYVTLSELHEPYRAAALAATRAQLEVDITRFERLQREGGTIFLTPEGFYSGDGKMQRLRGVLARLVPLAQAWLAGISYDPFVGRRLSLLYRVQRAQPGLPLDVQLKALRPVTTSALLATWLREMDEPFRAGDALAAVERQLRMLPASLFVDPELARRPAVHVRRALAGMHRRGMLECTGGIYDVRAQRAHPHFSRTPDMIAYQANFHAETLRSAPPYA